MGRGGVGGDSGDAAVVLVAADGSGAAVVDTTGIDQQKEVYTGIYGEGDVVRKLAVPGNESIALL